MTLDLDALEALEKKATPVQIGATFDEWIAALKARREIDSIIRNALHELIRLARIGQRVERDRGVRKEPDFLSQALNEGDGVYRP